MGEQETGRVIWITGLSGAGKTTLARALLLHLDNPILLDGDEMREALSEVAGGYDAINRKRLGFTYAKWARLLASQGFTVVVATISMYKDLYDWNRENLPNYFEIFLDIPKDIRESRNSKGLYKNNNGQEALDMAGVSVNVEPPINSDFILTDQYSLENSVNSIKNLIFSRDGHC